MFSVIPHRKIGVFILVFFLSLSSVQVDDYSSRKDMKVEEVERWLAPILGYDAEEGV